MGLDFGSFYPYDVFVPASVCVLLFLFCTAVPKKKLFRKLKCTESERDILMLPTMWLRGSLFLEYTDKWLAALAFGSSIIVVIMVFENPMPPGKVALYTAISIIATVLQWAIPFRDRSVAFRESYNMIKRKARNYQSRFIDDPHPDSDPSDPERMYLLQELEDIAANGESRIEKAFHYT